MNVMWMTMVAVRQRATTMMTRTTRTTSEWIKKSFCLINIEKEATFDSKKL